MDDLIERLQLIAELSGALTSSEAASIAAQAITRIAALEADNARLRHDLDVTGVQYQKVVADNARLLELVETAAAVERGRIVEEMRKRAKKLGDAGYKPEGAAIAYAADAIARGEP